MCNYFTEDDKDLVKELYDLNDKEILEAEKMHSRSPFSVCKSADIIKGRRITGHSDKNICGGCDAGMIIKEGIHYNKFGGAHALCQKSKYNDENGDGES